MKVLSALGTLGGIILAGSGAIMAISNPDTLDYEDYASESLTDYLKQEVCPQAPPDLGGLIQSYCKTLVDTGKPQLRQVISRTTTQQNFFIFTIYETTLTLPEPLPSYEFQTLGIMQRFYTYEASKI